MERFVLYVVAGGLLLVAGLWFTTLWAPFDSMWLAGAVLTLAGATGLTAGIWRIVEWSSTDEPSGR